MYVCSYVCECVECARSGLNVSNDKRTQGSFILPTTHTNMSRRDFSPAMRPLEVCVLLQGLLGLQALELGSTDGSCPCPWVATVLVKVPFIHPMPRVLGDHAKVTSPSGT